MNNMENMNETIENNTNAVSIYGSESPMDEFPILKAFQEYIDAEQARARKRMTAMAIFFGAMMIALIAIFVSLLVRSYGDNQHLNDRLVEYMQQERERSDKEHAERERLAAEAAAKPPQDSAAVLALTKKIEELQEKIYATQRKADDAERSRMENERKLVEQEKLMAEKDKQAAEKLKQAIEDAKPKGPTPEEQEIARLKALLAAEKEKQREAVDKERRRQAELEEYRRKHYPQYYQRQATPTLPSRTLTIGNLDMSTLPQYDETYDNDEIDLPDEDTAISYYDDEAPAAPVKKKAASPSMPKPAVMPPAKVAPRAAAPKAASKASSGKKYSIPVEVKKSDISVWDIPEF